MNNELIERIEELKEVRTRLKCGEYDGIDIMRAWIAIDELIDCKAALTEKREDEDHRELKYHLLASEMVYEGNSVQHWRNKALAYKECAGVIFELKQLLGVETPKEVLAALTQQQETIDTKHRLMVSAEKRGHDKAMESQQQEAEPVAHASWKFTELLRGLGMTGAINNHPSALYAQGKRIADLLDAAKESRYAAQPQVPEGYALTPIEPADGLLISMACRGRHDFGLLSRGMQESIMGSMRQVHEEVVGAGFYNPDKEAEYKSMLNAAKEEGK